MKYIFFSILGILIIASIGTALVNTWIAGDKPIIYWVTGSNPARALQVENFQAWMKKNNYPDIDLRVDAANMDGRSSFLSFAC